MDQKTQLRDATTVDCTEIAKLYLIASGGLAEYIWGPSPGSSDEALEAGRRYHAREDTDMSWQNCRIAEIDGRTVGMTLAFEILPKASSRAGGEASPVIDPVLKPYEELEMPGSYYIEGLAIHAQYRGMGLAKRLLLDAQERAMERGLPTISLICYEANKNAKRLYEHLGYRERDRRAIVPHASLQYTKGDAVLMAKSL